MTNADIGLIFKAQNLAGSVVADVANDIEAVGRKAGDVAGKIGGAFKGMGSQVAIGLGMVTETLASGGGLGVAAAQLGIFMAGQLAEQFSGQIIEKIAGSSFIAIITAPLSAVGTAMGSIMAAAVPIGIAALPFILIGALVAAIAVLIVNEEIRNKVISFVQGVATNIGKFLGQFLGGLPKILGDAFAAAWQFVLDAVQWYIDNVVTLWFKIPQMLIGLGGDIVRTIVNGLAGLPGQVADIVRNAFASLDINVGPFHITGHGITADFPEIKIPGLATGIERDTGGVRVVGEDGPELVHLRPGASVTPNYRLPGPDAGGGSFAPAGPIVVQMDGRAVAKIVDERLYVRRQAVTGA